MTALSSTLKWRDLVAMGLHVGNIFLNREASPIEVVETAHVISLQTLVLFLKIMTKNDITIHIYLSKLRRSFL